MKKIFAFVFSVFVFVSVIAQKEVTNSFHLFDKHKNILGTNFGFGKGSGRLSGEVNLRYGHFFFNKFSAGVQAGLGKFYFMNKYNLGVFTRYYLLNKRLSPFVETNYGFQHFTYKGEYPGIANAHTLFGGFGLEYSGIFKHFGVELFYGYNYQFSYYFPQNKPRQYYEGSYNSFGLRINYHF